MRVLLALIIILTVQVVFAAAPEKMSDREKRVLNETVALSALAGIEHKYGVVCAVPEKANSVHWMCLNGPQCGYSFEVKCAPEGMGGIASLILPEDKPVTRTVKISGLDTGAEANLASLVIELSESK
jgi:hypothetical protein